MWICGGEALQEVLWSPSHYLWISCHVHLSKSSVFIFTSVVFASHAWICPPSPHPQHFYGSLCVGVHTIVGITPLVNHRWRSIIIQSDAVANLTRSINELIANNRCEFSKTPNTKYTRLVLTVVVREQCRFNQQSPTGAIVQIGLLRGCRSSGINRPCLRVKRAVYAKTTNR